MRRPLPPGFGSASSPSLSLQRALKRAAGALRCDAEVQTAGALARETADPDLKDRRRSVAVPGTGQVLADYVPFYVAPRSPTLLRVATGRVHRHSDLPRMGEWSTENTGGTWQKGATGAAVGARFKGTNQNGKKTWSTTATVTTCQPGRGLAFDVSVGPIAVSQWQYVIEPLGPNPSRVTESTNDRRARWLLRLTAKASGVADRPAANRASMEHTLERLEATATGTAKG